MEKVRPRPSKTSLTIPVYGYLTDESVYIGATEVRSDRTMAEACAARPVPPQSYAEYTGRVG